MRTEKLNSTLLSTLIVVSLMAPAVSIVLAITAGQVSADPGPADNIIRAKATARTYTPDQTGDPPWKWYVAGDRPPLIVAENNIGSGAVVAGGIANAMRNGYWNGYVVPDNYLDEFLDAAFQWMVPGATNLLWYEGYNVYGDTTACSDMVTALEGLGYTIGTTENAFENINTAAYDIWVINQLQLGDAGTGGNPDLLPSVDLTAIKNFVEGGGGLLIAEGSDFFIHQYYKVQDKILNELGFGMFFQSDQIIDPVTNYGEEWQLPVDVDVSHPIGSAFQAATGKTSFGIPSACSLAPLEDYNVSVAISPGYMEGLPGGTLKYYYVTVTNMGLLEDNYTLTISDNSGWTLTLSDNLLPNVPGLFSTRTENIIVNIPGSALPGAVDNVTVTVTGDGGSSDSYYCLAIAGRQIRPTMDDAQVVEGEPTRTAGAQSFMYVGSSLTGRYKNERAILKFDLQGIASGDNITSNNARLFVYGFTVGGTPGKNVELRKVDNDGWVEEDITWNDQPAYGDLIGTTAVENAAAWYSWDVTSYLSTEYAGNQIASFCIKAETENLAYPDNFSYGFDTKEFSSWAHPRIAIGRNVWVTIDPEYREGLPGGTVKYNVDVWNMGTVADTYDLENVDNSGWGLTISPTSLSLSAGEKGTATLSVTIPESAEICVDNDNIHVVATSQNDSTVKDNAWTIAHAAKRVKPAMPDTSTKDGTALPPTIWGIEATIDVGRYANGRERGWLRFDLEAIPYLENITRARLVLQSSSTPTIGLGTIVQVYSVVNDTWIEDENWTSTPSIGSLLDTRAVTEANETYSWEVTDYVRQEFQSDNLASFALVHLGENLDTVDSATQFISRDDYGVENEWPYLEILCTEQLPTREVRTSISPVFQGGLEGKTLDYTVTVKNTGTAGDTYDLTVDDNLGWGATVLPSPLTIAAGASDNATLSVTVPSGTVCTTDNMTVTATSQADNTVNDSAVAYAHLSGVEFKLENLYKIRLYQKVGPSEINTSLRLREDADNLVTKFKTYGGVYQAEDVVYSGITPWHLTGIFDVPHPLGSGTQKVDLVLVDETGTVLATVDTFTVDRNVLFGRLTRIYLVWPFANAQLRNVLFGEISAIYLQWPFAP